LASLYEKRLESVNDYIAWQAECGREIINKISEFYEFNSNTVCLDIGFGRGGQTYEYSYVFGTVVAIEYSMQACLECKNRFPRSGILWLRADGTSIPAHDESFDIIIASNVFEHIYNPEALFSEIVRITKPGGLIFVNFLPYYNRLGGHLYNFFGYKWPHLLLSKRQIEKKLSSVKPIGFWKPEDEWNQYLSLNKISLRRFENIVKRHYNKLLILKFDYAFAKRVTGFIPFVRELFISAITFIAKKTSS